MDRLLLSAVVNCCTMLGCKYLCEHFSPQIKVGLDWLIMLDPKDRRRNPLYHHRRSLVEDPKDVSQLLFPSERLCKMQKIP